MKTRTNLSTEEVIIICIGNELLNGQIVNTNLQYLGHCLYENGLQLTREISIADDEEEIKATLQPLLAKSTTIITIGGLGATSDDITRQTIAELLGKELVVDAAEAERIRLRLKLRGRQIKEEYIQNQAKVIMGCEKLANPNGAAVGMYLHPSEHVRLFMLPGPPHECCPMFEQQVIPRLNAHNFSHIIKEVGYFVDITESDVVSKVESIMEAYPQLHIAYCAAPSQVRITLQANQDESETLQEAWEKIGGELAIYSLPEGCKNLPQALAFFLKKQQGVMATAESCTGGLIAKLLTDESGSSSWYHGSLITYDNAWKHHLLGVSNEVLEQYGAVSHETAEAMIDGLLKNYPVIAGIAVTGIAGPGGGTEDKPVGLVYIATGTAYARKIKKYLFRGDREAIRYQTAILGMLQLFKTLQETQDLLDQHLLV